MSIVVLNNTVNLDENISVIKLPTENASCPEVKIMTVRGWGLSWLDEFNYKPYQNIPSRYLMAAKQQCLDVENHCSNKKHFGNGIICAGDPTNTKNAACYRDIGGN